jgi:hydrogenase maturation protein HypF
MRRVRAASLRQGVKVERRAVVVRGIVQGVGFRPYVYRLATHLGLGGFVRNQSGSVLIEIEGDPPQLDRFLEEVSARPPRLAQVDDLSWEPRSPEGDQAFRVEESRSGPPRDIAVAADVAMCGSCRAELRDPNDRRYQYPFLNCTDCGPRLTIITGSPYDRMRTTMAGFPMCADCRSEYDDPADRRFHAEPTACPACGPRLRFHSPSGGAAVPGVEPLEAFAALLREGRIGALQGLGGFHLVCDARRDDAVALLRARKGREEKPFAVMVRDAEAALEFCWIDPLERSLLEGVRAPIVLLRRRNTERVEGLSSAVAPGRLRLGLLLPYTPLHDLLMDEMGGIPLVMTSGNRSDEPIAFDDRAIGQLSGIADGFLLHDRPIRVRCDDTVTRVIDGAESPVRRSRGYAPEPIRLPYPLQGPTLAVGGQLKATFALGRGDVAFLSHHLGDLEHEEAQKAFLRDIRLFESLFGFRPERLVHDLHPDYASTDYARVRAAKEGLDLVAVQHHHAHMASVMAENGLHGPVIGVTFDGMGYGTDGTLWGGEFLVGDYRGFRRAAHLEPFAMPGGEQAIEEPWRMALSLLVATREPLEPIETRMDALQLEVVWRLLQRGVNCPRTSSMGRLFDGVASLLGVRDRVSYEGQAAVELEGLAAESGDPGRYPVSLIDRKGSWLLEFAPLVRGILEDRRRGTTLPDLARRFHSTVVEMIRSTAVRVREQTGLGRVVLTGGVFANELLLSEVPTALRREGFRVHTHHRVPSNDGGLSLGQLAVAAGGGGIRPCV